MNVLFISAVLPYPLYSGGQIRMYNLLKRLAKKHRITLISFIRDQKEKSFDNDLSFCDQVQFVLRGRAVQPSYILNGLFGTYPWLLSTYDNQHMRERIGDVIATKHIDILHAEPFYVWPSIPDIQVPVVVSEHNIEYDVYEQYVRHFPVSVLRPFMMRDVDKIKKWEHYVWRNANRLTAVSQSDASVMQNYLSHPISVIPNGVDLPSLPFQKKKDTHHRLLFVGNFRWVPNRDAAKRLVTSIWPIVREKYPDAELAIVGRDMPSLLEKEIRNAGGSAQSNVKSIAESYAWADVMVAPHGIAGGTKFKILEAFASGLPVVTTYAGITGIEANDGHEYLSAKTDAEFAHQIFVVFEQQKKMESITYAARILIEHTYNWDFIAQKLETVWKEAYERT
jgi:polysaccharide biosynthesis protein PslH